MRLFNKWIKNKVYTTLRTKNNLGYIVYSYPTLDDGIIGFKIRIQGGKFSALDMQNYLDKFWRNVYKKEDAYAKDNDIKDL